MASNPVPVLGTQGFVHDTAGKFNQLMAWFMSSEYSESYLYYGKVTSLPKILQEAGQNEEKIVAGVREGLTRLLSRYHDKVSIVATARPSSEPGKQDQLQIDLSVTVSDQLTDITQKYLLRTSDSMIQEIIRINNTGV